jgi:hypothetical protein
MATSIPQQISDALQMSLDARSAVDDSQAVVDSTGATLVQATAATNSAVADHTAKVATLNAARQHLESLLDDFLTPGGTLPTPDSSTTPPDASAGVLSNGAA